MLKEAWFGFSTILPCEIEIGISRVVLGLVGLVDASGISFAIGDSCGRGLPRGVDSLMMRGGGESAEGDGFVGEALASILDGKW